MKRFNLLPVVLVLVLLVGVTSCTTIGGAQDVYDERPATGRGNRIYVDDPYRGTVVLERDMVTGRYFEIGTIGAYGGYWGNRFNDPWAYGFGNRFYGGGYYGNGGYYRGGQGSVRPQPQQPSQEDRRRNEQNREDARRKVLGGN